MEPTLPVRSSRLVTSPPEGSESKPEQQQAEVRSKLRGQRSGAGPAGLAHLQDVASPEAELGVAGGREVVLPLSLHQDQADRRDPGPFCRRRKQKPASLRLTGLNQLQSESLGWKIISIISVRAFSEEEGERILFLVHLLTHKHNFSVAETASSWKQNELKQLDESRFCPVFHSKSPAELKSEPTKKAQMKDVSRRELVLESGPSLVTVRTVPFGFSQKFTTSVRKVKTLLIRIKN